MKANDTSIRIYLEGSKQFIVPLFQRTYSWRRENIQRLWDDIEDTGSSEPESTHFFGSFVTFPVPSPASGVSKYVIIDGQQRLVTTFVFLAAVRNKILEIMPDYDKKDEINELYLINKYHPADKYKVVPTQADREIFFKTINECTFGIDGDHLILDSLNFFRDRLSPISDLDLLLNLKDTILQRFSVVDIKLDNNDDPYLIFECLNATGTPLTQADLIRNYLFMRIDQDRQQDVYDNAWLPMQQRLRDYLEDFVRHYLAIGGAIPAYNRIYATFKHSTDLVAKSSEDVVNRIRELSKYSNYYHKFLQPKNEIHEGLRKYLEKFNRIEVTTSYPLLLNLYDDYDNGRISDTQLRECLKTIETYIVRRGVCGIAAQALNRYFPTIYKSLDQANINASLKNMLRKAGGAQRMPTDEEFRQCLTERSLYGTRILKYVLEQIENHENKEPVDFSRLQIEHIMPQKLNDEWEVALGDNWEFIHQKYLDNLGNLTLTGYNPEYSNKSFKTKRDCENGFTQSRLRLNSDLAKLNSWNEEEIKKRAERLAELALEIWAV
jgi:uncharacterized protein with ParB-like and HNH nuclease domain